MSPPNASPRASCLSVNIGENCVLIKSFDPNVDLDFPKIVQNFTLITLLGVPYLCHFGSTSFVLPIRPKYGTLNRVIGVFISLKLK